MAQDVQAHRGLFRIGCVRHEVVGTEAPIVAVGRAILPGTRAVTYAPPASTVVVHAPVLRVRSADPPESPPPFLAA